MNRKFRTLRAKQNYFESKHPYRSHMTAVKNLDQFGSTAPSITIGSRFQEKHDNGFDQPGPGYYNIYRRSSLNEIPGHIIQKKFGEDQPSITRNADFLPQSNFLPSKGIKIGVRDGFHYDAYNQASEPKFDLGSTLSKQGFTIRPRTAMRTIDESIPGPGQYTLPNNNLKKGISFNRAKSSELWEPKDFDDNPGPGAYNVVTFTKPKKWTERLRVRPLPNSGYVSRPSLLDEITRLSKPASPR